MRPEQIRNFTIIAHIDHGKSTLADRMLEVTKTMSNRELREQSLDTMDLERERGITIKMQPATMQYEKDGATYLLNLIDTPGHIDFTYEVSRALTAVEGAILLVDATQGVQAQTLSTLAAAKEQKLKIIPALSKVDVSRARVDEVALELAELVGCNPDEILHTSGKTGVGVEDLLRKVIDQVPSPQPLDATETTKLLVFDFHYDNHKGIVVHARVSTGGVKKTDKLVFMASQKSFVANDVGVFKPHLESQSELQAGQIGYIVTGVKEPGIANVGDTLLPAGTKSTALPGYKHPQPVVWASMFPESQDDFDELRQALDRLRLSDSSLQYEEEQSGALGRGFRAGFLGMLHMEIVTERLRREFNLELIVTTPSVTYEVRTKKGTQSIYAPTLFPDTGDILEIKEPMTLVTILCPHEYIDPVMPLFHEHEAHVLESETRADGRVQMVLSMPLRELMRGFFDRLKSASSGYASLSYSIEGQQIADVIRLDILVAEERVPALSRIVPRYRVEQEGRAAVEKLYEILPRQQFATKIQANGTGRIVASKTLSALRKDVTGHLYGGDITRKKKLLEKQKKGKKRMLSQGKVQIPQEVFMKMIRLD